MRHLLNPAAAPFALTDLFDQVYVLFRIGIAVLACYVIFRAFKGKFGDSLAAVAILLIGCAVWGLYVVSASPDAGGLFTRLSHLFG